MVVLTEQDGFISLWSGGSTMQLMISPYGSMYNKRNFDFRISIATIAEEESKFTHLPDYTRQLVALTPVKLRNETAEIGISPYEIYSFDGAERVESFGKARDFGVMCRKGVCRSRIEVMTLEQGSVYKGGDVYVYTAEGYTAESGDGLRVISDKAVLLAVHIEYELQLVLPHEGQEEIWGSAMEEFSLYGETPTPFGFSMNHSSFSAFLADCTSVRLLQEPTYDREKGYLVAPTTTYFLTNREESRIYGTISVRRLLTEGLRKRGGNVGYGIMPSCRGKGYGVKMLELCLQKCRDMGLFAVMLTCDSSNMASKTIMLRNGAVLYGADLDDDGTPYERYYIIL